jgi:hypothetical protein
MRVIQLSAKAGPDGVLHLDIPVGSADGEYEVAVVVQAKPSANGARQPTPEELGWPPGYFEKVVGSITDESFVAPPRRPPKPIEPLDADSE